MHPIERLRSVARWTGGDQRSLVSETANAIAPMRGDPAGLVVACRRIVERHPTAGALWWLCAHLVTSPEPGRAAWALAEQIDQDPTTDRLIDALPDGATVCVVGWPDLIAEALVRRGDLRVIVVDGDGRGEALVRRLMRADVEVVEATAAGAAGATLSSDLVLIEAAAAGPDGALCGRGSHVVAAVGYCAEIPVWLVAGRGRRLPGTLWTSMQTRLAESGDAWEHEVELVPLAMLGAVIGPNGASPADAASLAAECPQAPELLTISVI